MSTPPHDECDDHSQRYPAANHEGNVAQRRGSGLQQREQCDATRHQCPENGDYRVAGDAEALTTLAKKEAHTGYAHKHVNQEDEQRVQRREEIESAKGCQW